MKTRKQPVRQARRSGRLASKSGIKQQLKQQIQLSSSLSSSSCASTSPPMENHEYMEKHIHRWQRREEKYLVKLTKDPEIAAVFEEDFVKGCAMIAEKINKHWSRPDNYVPLDAIKVESKLKGCKQAFAKTDKEGPSQSASQGALYSDFGEAITSALSLRAKKVAKKQVSASSGEKKVAKEKKRKFFNSRSALEYMMENGSSYRDLCLYANALKKPGVLDVFNIVKTFEEKEKMFNEILDGEKASGKWTGSKGKLAPPIHDLTESSSEEE